MIKHLSILDLLRGVAILVVFLFHCLGATFGMFQLPWGDFFRTLDCSKSFLALSPLSYGYYGVAVFFAVSGYCIHQSHAKASKHCWGIFFKNRFFRIYPPYLISLFAFFFIWPTLNFNFSGERAWQLVSHLFLVHNMNSRTLFGINPAFWTIALEVQLYAIYPLLLLFAKRFGWVAALLLAAFSEISIQSIVAFGLMSSAVLPPAALMYSPFAYWLSWSLGAYLADCHLNGRTSFFSSTSFSPLLAVAVLCPLIKPTYPFAFLTFAFTTCVFLDKFIAQNKELPTSGALGWLSKHFQKLGILSYSYYLLHQPLVNQTKSIFYSIFQGVHIHPYVIFGFSLLWYPVVYALALVFFRFVEKPCTQVGKALLKTV